VEDRLGIFSHDSGYDRTRILEAASRARARKRYRKAIALYRRVLAVEPANLELHVRLAPLLAVTGRHFDAWTSFDACGRAAIADKRFEQAINVYREAARCMPREIRAWQEIARIERQRGRSPQAGEALLEGRQQFRKRRVRPEAISLLRQALEIDPSSSDIVLDLARLLARSDQESEAQLLLDRLAQRSEGANLRRVRSAQWRISPTLVNTWRLLHATITSGSEAPKQRIHA
jgi:tetratricopeptide (TPR) repeat protein